MDMGTPNYSIALVSALDSASNPIERAAALGEIVGYAFDGERPEARELWGWIAEQRAWLRDADVEVSESDGTSQYAAR